MSDKIEISGFRLFIDLWEINFSFCFFFDLNFFCFAWEIIFANNHQVKTEILQDMGSV